jgi:Protein of unknown function (DUF1236)
MNDRPLSTRTPRRMLLAAASFGVIALFAVIAWPLLPNSGNPRLSPPSAETGQRSNQGEGESAAGKSAGPQTDARAAPDAGTRGRDISGTASNEVKLSPEQRQAIRTHLTQGKDQPRIDRANFTLSVGAAVPREAPAREMPPELAGALPEYGDDHYLLVGEQLVIIERESRRIVAIIPTAG